MKPCGSGCRHHIRTTVSDWIHLSGRLCSWNAPVFAVFSCNTVLETGSSRARRQYRIVMGQYNSVDIGILKPNRIVCINVKNIVIIQQMIKYRSIALKNLKFAFENLSKTIIEIYTLCLKKTSPTFLAITRESIDGFLQYLAEMLLRKQAIICCYIFPPHLINASTLPCETENTEIVCFHVNVSC